MPSPSFPRFTLGLGMVSYFGYFHISDDVSSLLLWAHQLHGPPFNYFDIASVSWIEDGHSEDSQPHIYPLLFDWFDPTLFCFPLPFIYMLVQGIFCSLGS